MCKKWSNSLPVLGIRELYSEKRQAGREREREKEGEPKYLGKNNVLFTYKFFKLLFS